MFSHHLSSHEANELSAWLRLSLTDGVGNETARQWLAAYGLPLMALSRLTGLVFLPMMIAAPLAILPLIGWASLGGRIGLFAPMWFAGLATMIALFARPENFYWVQLGLPAYGIGLAFAPRAIFELARSLLGRA